MENTDILIEGSTATWVLPPTDSSTGGTYTGRFTFRCFLSPTQQLQAGRELREFLGSHASLAGNSEVDLAFALVQLRYRIIKAPPFWESAAQDSGMPGDIGDLHIIGLVMDAASRAEILFKDKIAKERESILDRAIKTGEDLMHKNSEEE